MFKLSKRPSGPVVQPLATTLLAGALLSSAVGCEEDQELVSDEAVTWGGTYLGAGTDEPYTGAVTVGAGEDDPGWGATYLGAGSDEPYPGGVVGAGTDEPYPGGVVGAGSDEPYVIDDMGLDDMGPDDRGLGGDEVPPGGVEVPPEPERQLESGRFLLGLGLILDATKPSAFIAEITFSQNDEGARSLTSMRLAPLMCANIEPTMPTVGEPIVYEPTSPVEINAQGAFVADLGEQSVAGGANCISGSFVSADFTLIGQLINQDAFCGDVQGQLILPFEFSLAGSTFAATRLTEGQVVSETTLYSSCAALEEAQGGGSTGGAEGGSTGGAEGGSTGGAEGGTEGGTPAPAGEG